MACPRPVSALCSARARFGTVPMRAVKSSHVAAAAVSLRSPVPRCLGVSGMGACTLPLGGGGTAWLFVASTCCCGRGGG
eukprot:9467898-Prorocentrum_lima.AAC.1